MLHEKIYLTYFFAYICISNSYAQNRTEADAKTISAYLPGQWKIVKSDNRRIYFERTTDIFSVGRYYIISRDGILITKTVEPNYPRRCGNDYRVKKPSFSGYWHIDEDTIFTTRSKSNSRPTHYYIIEVSHKHLVLEIEKLPYKNYSTIR
ncbi:hypothetical protein DVK85_10440 [Flavobacterium arcticum]|uniref:Lipocalin-like domain-containing protein n=1 Tax=Flavobacterium arcticum TaxID=1784713 RepID=A0A345HDG9_9FLAO|nr:hypothetical protein [Flavobacterium arcticum]AXG74629.1 hypothetical protein DVK85_10440 [Flavobacterium arcticum]KAF2512247.1 hypothetical protein E0W72_03225 [Flavobacterium arcticum]